MIEIDIHKTFSQNGRDHKMRFEMRIDKGEFVTVIGESGEGKTSLLRMIAGLLNPDSGQISVDSTIWFSTAYPTNLLPQKRGVGFVFQDYALFPNMSVLENLKFAASKESDEIFIDELLETMELKEVQYLNPMSLSGGQQQRVALARALVQKPKILLLDEPLSALDYEMRKKLQNYLLEIHKKYKLTTIMVSHDISQTIKMSDTVFVLKEGEIIKNGSPISIFSEKVSNVGSQLKGEIIKVESTDDQLEVTVLIGNQTVKVYQDLKDQDKYALGSETWVKVS